MNSYGIPFKGSKNSLADWIFKYLPPAQNLYDIFAGGGAITHYALLNSKWGNVYANDIGRGFDLFLRCKSGELYLDPVRLNPINKKMVDFMEKKDFDVLAKTPYTELEPWQNWLLAVWSYCADFTFYRCGKGERTESIKKMHNAAFHLDLKPMEELIGKDLSIVRSIKDVFKRVSFIYKEMESSGLGETNCCQQYGCMKRMNAIYESFHNPKGQQLSMFFEVENTGANFYHTNVDYREVEIRPNSIIYADPPYRDSKYFNAYSVKKGEFDSEAFYDWVEKQSAPVLISEYWMPEERFVCVSEHIQFGTTCMEECRTRKMEKLYVPIGQYEGFWKKIVEKVQPEGTDTSYLSTADDFFGF